MAIDQKKYRLSGTQIQTLVTGYGGCIASDRITVDGCLVGYMYRQFPKFPSDSGWRFLAGDEGEAYMANNSNHSVYDVNVIANYDPSIIAHLDAPVDSELERETQDDHLRVIDT